MANDVILERTEESKGIYFILRGRVISYRKNNKFAVSILVVGDDLGDCCISGQRSHLTYQCVTDTVCIMVDRDNLETIMRKYPQDELFLRRRTLMRQNYIKTLYKETHHLEKSHHL